MKVDMELPVDTETERLLLGSLLLMQPGERDQAIMKLSFVWFSDPWHRRLFEVIRMHRRRDFGQEMLDSLRTNESGNVAWWLAMLFCDRNGESTSGRPILWRQYAATLEKLHGYRTKMLLLIEELRDLENAAVNECRPLCQPTGQNAGVNEQAPGPRANPVLDRPAKP